MLQFYKNHPYIMNAISVLLLSIFANMIFSVKLDFTAEFDCFLIIKFVCLMISSFSVSYSLLKLDHLREIAKNELDERIKSGSTNLKTSKEIFDEKLNVPQNVKNIKIALYGLFIPFILLFFFLEPVIKAICLK
ncbi:hypothetical protein FACS1894155_02320 [Bacteroidia bacterium]|nr:hypothetical protein FACS1894155_02320 [Bacteroidia bacterium]